MLAHTHARGLRHQVGRCLEAVSDLLGQLEGSREQAQHSRAAEAAAARKLAAALAQNEALKARLRACGTALRPYLAMPGRPRAADCEREDSRLQSPPRGVTATPAGAALGMGRVGALAEVERPQLVEAPRPAQPRRTVPASHDGSPFLSPGLRRAAERAASGEDATTLSSALMFDPSAGPHGSFFLAGELPKPRVLHGPSSGYGSPASPDSAGGESEGALFESWLLPELLDEQLAGRSAPASDWLAAHQQSERPAPAMQARHGAGAARDEHCAEAPYGSTAAAYGSTEAPYGSTEAPYGSTEAPYGSTEAPYGSTAPAHHWRTELQHMEARLASARGLARAEARPEVLLGSRSWRKAGGRGREAGGSGREAGGNAMRQAGRPQEQRDSAAGEALLRMRPPQRAAAYPKGPQDMSFYMRAPQLLDVIDALENRGGSASR